MGPERTKTATLLAATADAKGKRVVIKAGGGHHVHHEFHKRHFFVARSGYGDGRGYDDGCGYAKSLWSKTGNDYWKNRDHT